MLATHTCCINSAAWRRQRAAAIQVAPVSHVGTSWQALRAVSFAKADQYLNLHVILRAAIQQMQAAPVRPSRRRSLLLPLLLLACRCFDRRTAAADASCLLLCHP